MEQQKQRQAIDRFLADNPELEQLRAKLATFNVFRALKIDRVEIRHSNALAWLLDPSESHGLGDIFLRRILSNMLLECDAKFDGLSAARVELMDMGDVEVRREWMNTDVLVVIHGQIDVVLLIENKIGSGEGPGQLERYRKAISKEFPNILLVPVFLTLDGQASEDEEATDYLCYSHAQVLEVLSRIYDQRRSQLPEAVAAFLDNYIETLRRLTMKDEGLIELCKTIYRRHKDAIDLIMELGSTNEYQRIVKEVFEKDGDFEILADTPLHLRFIPKSWAEVVPENGVAWRNLTRPVSIAGLIFKQPDHIRLFIEVSAMDDPKLRLECVKQLSAAGCRFIKKAFAEDAQYSRFISHKHMVNDFDDEDEVRGGIKTLLDKVRAEIPKVKTALQKTFQK